MKVAKREKLRVIALTFFCLPVSDVLQTFLGKTGFCRCFATQMGPWLNGK